MSSSRFEWKDQPVTPEEYRSSEARAALRAAAHRLGAVKADMDVAGIRATRAIESFVKSLVEGERWAFEGHPDVQETVAQMRGFYDPE